MSRDFVARPRVIVSVIATVDGRVTLSRAERLLDEVPNRSWRTLWPADADEMLARRSAWIEQRYQPSVVLQGSGTFVNDDTGPLELPDTETDEDLWNDFLPHKSRRWFAVVDGRGRVGWRFKGDGETSLLVITSRSAPLPYLAYLRRESIPYLVAGDERVNLRAVLVKIRELLGAESVVSDAGGGLNGALIASGLVDKLHVITVPGLIGGPGTPSIMDGHHGNPARPRSHSARYMSRLATTAPYGPPTSSPGRPVQTHRSSPSLRRPVIGLSERFGPTTSWPPCASKVEIGQGRYATTVGCRQSAASPTDQPSASRLRTTTELERSLVTTRLSSSSPKPTNRGQCPPQSAVLSSRNDVPSTAKAATVSSPRFETNTPSPSADTTISAARFSP